MKQNGIYWFLFSPDKRYRDMRKYEKWYDAGKLYREHAIADGAGVCDYWSVGDRVKNPR